MSPELPPPREGLGLLLKALLGGLAIVVLTSAAVATASLLQIEDLGVKAFPKAQAVVIPKDIVTPAKPGAPQTLLLVGTDRRYGAKRGEALSDTMMLVRLDPGQEATAVLNVPRDLVTEIPGQGRQKINAAYSLGGLSLVAETVKQTLGLTQINHAMAVDFKGFRGVVNSLGCIYADVDRRYFNDNTGPGPDYAVIDVQPGYQRLCGQRALDYVRFRHTDSDFVRAARQQNFLRDAKDQVGTSSLISNYEQLLTIFGRSTQADASLQESKQVLRLLEQGVLSASQPVRQISFPGELNEDPGGLGSFVTASEDALARTRREFLAATKPQAPAPKPKVVRQGAKRAAQGKRTGLEDFGLVDARRLGEDLVAPLEARNAVPFPIYFPQGLTRRGRYARTKPAPRTYELRDRAGNRHTAYRIVVEEDELNGDYWGVQGTTWKRPPILAQAKTTQRLAGRTYRLLYDGRKLRIVAWQTERATYWVSNTLGLALSNTEMLGIARSLTRVGA